eukprot:6410935-Amphidinium_carterae.1
MDAMRRCSPSMDTTANQLGFMLPAVLQMPQLGAGGSKSRDDCHDGSTARSRMSHRMEQTKQEDSSCSSAWVVVGWRVIELVSCTEVGIYVPGHGLRAAD